MFIVRLFLISCLVAGSGAQTPFLLKDINPTPVPSPGAYPTPQTTHYSFFRPTLTNKFTRIGSTFYFEANNGASGLELFKATMTPGSASLVKDINPGSGGASLQYLTPAGGKLFFRADDGVSGHEPWVSDGTAAGTRRLFDYGGAASGDMYFPIAMGGYCYFCTKSPAGGYDLVKSDGTQAGTTVLKTFLSDWDRPATTGSFIVFRGHESATGSEAWVTDGTATGTRLLLDAHPNGSGKCHFPVAMGGRIYYWAENGTDCHIYETDGTPGNTRKIGRPAGFTSTSWQYLTVLGNKIIFRGFLGTGYDPWVFDGTLAGTHLLKDLESGFAFPAVIGNKCYFTASQGGKSALWVTDGTQSGTYVVKVCPSGSIYHLEGLGNNILFSAEVAGQGEELWISDGTEAGTRLLKEIMPGFLGSGPRYMTSYNGQALFRARNDVTGYELFITDGTTAGTGLHTDIFKHSQPKTRPSAPYGFTNACGVTYFSADDGTGRCLWKTDGTNPGTVKLPAQQPEFIDRANLPVTMGHRIFFEANDPIHGRGPWVSDGTPAGTTRLVDGLGGSVEKQFISPVVMNGFCYWWSYGTSKLDLYKSDGLTTTLIGNCTSLGFDTNWSGPIVLGDRILFQVATAGNGYEVAVTDGTPPGTRFLMDINPGSGSGYFADPIVYNDEVYFRADAGSGYGLWKTDGTSAGTVLVKAGVDLPTGGYDYSLVAMGRMFLGGRKGFWVSDGTATGTTAVTISETFGIPHEFQGKVLFLGGSQYGGYALWETDGTPAGTRILYDHDPTYTGNRVNSMAVTGSRWLYFEMGTKDNGLKGFVTDGTTAGTRRIPDSNPNSQSGFMSDPILAGNGLLLFQSDDGALGEELYALDPGASILPVGAGTGPTLQGKDAIPGGTFLVQVVDLPQAGSAALLMGVPTNRPLMLGKAGIYLDHTLLYGFFPIPPGGLTFPIPNSSALVGTQVATQGLTVPGTGYAGLGFTRGLVFTFGL